MQGGRDENEYEEESDNEGEEEGENGIASHGENEEAKAVPEVVLRCCPQGFRMEHFLRLRLSSSSFLCCFVEFQRLVNVFRQT